MTRTTRARVAVAVIALALGAFALSVLDAGGPIRTVVIVLFLAVGPGSVLVPRIRLDDRVMELALIVPLSLSIDALVAGGMLYLELWSPSLILGVIVIATSAAGLWELYVASPEEPAPVAAGTSTAAPVQAAPPPIEPRPVPGPPPLTEPPPAPGPPPTPAPDAPRPARAPRRRRKAGSQAGS